MLTGILGVLGVLGIFGILGVYIWAPDKGTDGATLAQCGIV